MSDFYEKLDFTSATLSKLITSDSGLIFLFPKLKVCLRDKHWEHGEIQRHNFILDRKMNFRRAPTKRNLAGITVLNDSEVIFKNVKASFVVYFCLTTVSASKFFLQASFPLVFYFSFIITYLIVQLDVIVGWIKLIVVWISETKLDELRPLLNSRRSPVLIPPITVTLYVLPDTLALVP